MAWILIKDDKYLAGHSYVWNGYQFTWTRDEGAARRFGDGEAADVFKNLTGGRFEHRKNTRAELKKLAKEAQRCHDRNRSASKDLHNRINARGKLHCLLKQLTA